MWKVGCEKFRKAKQLFIAASAAHEVGKQPEIWVMCSNLDFEQAT